jgi:lysophospholipase L1-like esterase
VYFRELVTREALERFETVISEARRKFPDAIWIRLDQAPQLKSDEYYWDLVHLNAPGQALATRLLLAELKATGIAQ